MYSRQSTDVFIISGGPAGLAAAIASRQKGFQVVLSDGAAPPIDKPCGEGMMPETLVALRALGVELKSGEGRKFSGICLCKEIHGSLAIFRKGRD